MPSRGSTETDVAARYDLFMNAMQRCTQYPSSHPYVYIKRERGKERERLEEEI